MVVVGDKKIQKHFIHTYIYYRGRELINAKFELKYYLHLKLKGSNSSLFEK